MAERTVESVANELAKHRLTPGLLVEDVMIDNDIERVARYILRCERRAAREALEAAAEEITPDVATQADVSAEMLDAIDTLRRLAAQEGSDADEG